MFERRSTTSSASSRRARLDGLVRPLPLQLGVVEKVTSDAFALVGARQASLELLAVPVVHLDVERPELLVERLLLADGELPREDEGVALGVPVLASVGERLLALVSVDVLRVVLRLPAPLVAGTVGLRQHYVRATIRDVCRLERRRVLQPDEPLAARFAWRSCEPPSPNASLWDTSRSANAPNKLRQGYGAAITASGRPRLPAARRRQEAPTISVRSI